MNTREQYYVHSLLEPDEQLHGTRSVITTKAMYEKIYGQPDMSDEYKEDANRAYLLGYGIDF